MRFTGKNLELVEQALRRAMDDVDMQMGTCPDVVEYAEDIAQLEQEKTALLKMWGRVDAALDREQAR